MQDSSTTDDVVVVLSTFPVDGAGELATALVADGLAACVNLVENVRSIYRWQGAIQDGRETLAIIKTTRARLEDLEIKLRVLHPYEVPELLVLPVAGGLAAYLQWVVASVER